MLLRKHKSTSRSCRERDRKAKGQAGRSWEGTEKATEQHSGSTEPRVFSLQNKSAPRGQAGLAPPAAGAAELRGHFPLGPGQAPSKSGCEGGPARTARVWTLEPRPGSASRGAGSSPPGRARGPVTCSRCSRAASGSFAQARPFRLRIPAGDKARRLHPQGSGALGGVVACGWGSATWLRARGSPALALRGRGTDLARCCK